MQKVLEGFIAPVIPAVISAAASAAFAEIAASTIVIGLANAGIGFGNAIAIAQGLGSVVGGLASAAAGSAFGGGGSGKRNGAANSTALPLIEAASQRTPQRTTTGYREIVYGKTKRAGTVLFEKLASSGFDNNGDEQKGRSSFLNNIIAFAGHEIDSYEKIYIDDVELDIDADGWVLNTQFTKNTDDFAPKNATSLDLTYTADNATGTGTSASIYLDYAFATASNTIKPGDLITVGGFSDSAYNGSFQVTSIASHSAGAATLVNYTTDTTIDVSPISQSGCTFDINPVGYRGAVGYVYDNTGHGLSTGDNVYVYEASPDIYNSEKTPVLATPSSNTFTYALDSTPTQAATNATFERRNGDDSALVNIQQFLGGDTQDIYSSTDVADLMPDVLQSTDNFKGIACLYARFFDADEFSSAPIVSALVKGKKVYDYRDGTYAWSDNLALCMFDYLTWKNQSNDLAIGLGLNYDNTTQTSTDLDIDYWVEAAATCDEEVAISEAEYQKRYTMNGALSMGDQIIDNISKMLINGAAAITYVNGLFRLYVAGYQIPSNHIDEDWLAGDISISINNDKQDLTNTITGVYLNEDNLYYPDDFPQYQDATALSEDNNEQLSKDGQYPFITNSLYAQRMNKLYLNVSRQKMVVEMPLNYKGCRLTVWDTVYVTNRRLNWTNKVFRVIGFSASLTGGGINVILRTEDSSIYDWSYTEAA